MHQLYSGTHLAKKPQNKQQNKSNLYITYGPPQFGEYAKINEMISLELVKQAYEATKTNQEVLPNFQQAKQETN